MNWAFGGIFRLKQCHWTSCASWMQGVRKIRPACGLKKNLIHPRFPDLPFGWNIPNTAARAALMTRMDDLENLTFLTGHSCERLFTREGEARVTLSNGDRYRAKRLWRQMGAIPHARTIGDPCANHTFWAKGIGLCRVPPHSA